GGAGERERVTVEVGGKRLEVVLPAGLGASGLPAGAGGSGSGAGVGSGRGRVRRGGSGGRGAVVAGGGGLVSPMQGTIVKVAVAEGDVVAAGDVIVVLEAMKMEQPLTAHRGGVVAGLRAVVGQSVSAGAAICDIRDT
ncbi:biotin/lipoyl-containing protein, partial [Streptosporangium sp. NPDC051022]|uniref:acetyl-CoA carboxylase biotin carboxyl carrier protein subunit n=1 Tax=Streptosporangium sp. NPDC051022 TaxID=3155752 RepID=UPI00343B9A41